MREDLNKRAMRVMAVLNPVKVVIENWPEGDGGAVEWVEAVNNPEDESGGHAPDAVLRANVHRGGRLPGGLGQGLVPPGPGPRGAAEARLLHQGAARRSRTGRQVVELRCTYDPESGRGTTPDGRIVKGTLHWVSARTRSTPRCGCMTICTPRPIPSDAPAGQDFTANLNPNSLRSAVGLQGGAAAGRQQPGDRYQFLRHGYFCVDLDSTPGRLVFNRTVGLRDTWAKVEKKG